MSTELFLSIFFRKNLILKISKTKELIKKAGETVCMINFTKKYIYIISFIISIIIFYLIYNVIFIHKINSSEYIVSEQIQNQIEEINNNNENITKEDNKENTANQVESKTQKSKIIWQIEIPKINLKAEIAEGTTTEIMDAYVGHFEETSKNKGNIGLAAHNRGYKVNYFQNVKQLKEGDEIIYTYKKKQRKYEVKTLKIIKDTDWTMLENTEDNRITLITCVENQPEYRRCVQAVEK